MKDRFYWNEYKARSENKNRTNEYRYFQESSFEGLKRLFVLVCYSTKRYYLPKGFIKNYNVIINERKFYDRPTDFCKKRLEEKTKLTTGLGRDYIAGCLSDYEYRKNIMDK